MKTYKVIQWATGEVGMKCLKEVLRRPELELVGLLVYSDSKDGRDAGEIAGQGKIGVKATKDRDAIIAMDADCVIYTPLAPDMKQLDDDVVAILSSGKNIVTAAGYFAPQARGPEIVKRLEDACRIGKSTLFGNGIEPGILFDRVAPTITGMCADIEYIRLLEYSNATNHPAVVMLSQAIGIGQKQSEFHVGTPYGLYWKAFFSESMISIAHAMNVKLDRVDFELDTVLAKTDVHVPALGTVPKGTIQGARHRATGIVDGERYLRSEVHWYVGDSIPEWKTPPERYSWQVEIEGSPSVRMKLDPVPSLVRPQQKDPDPAFVATMAALLNAIPDVVAAPPGLFHAPIFAPFNLINRTPGKAK